MKRVLAFSALLLGACEFWGASVSCPAENDGGFTGRVFGCGDFLVARQSRDSLSILRFYSKVYGTHDRDTTYSVALGESSSVVVTIARYATPQSLAQHVCNDVMQGDDPVAVDTVRSGTATIRVYDFTGDSTFRTFRMDAHLSNLQITGSPVIDYVEMDSVLVGWLPG